MNRKISILIALFIILIPWLEGCDSTSEMQESLSPNSNTSEDKSDNETITLSQICNNNNVGYQINYPQGWQTNPGTVISPCQIFDPQSAIVPKNTESIDKAIYLRVEENVTFDLVTKENKHERHLSRQMTTIENRRAMKIESESTGKALLPSGTRTYSYIIDLDNSTLIALTYNLAGDRYQTNKQVLDRMMKTIKFDS
ncbi:hypothetical protein [Myxosarcina sp. GI1]|uniref:hypothetical protein n=1 Tax=Myxosarcina sp. GI1 TaxID=1541065 RepID=UPI00055C87E0|nr:hypothetical protein [Myxosarcina sp. GI1]